MNTIALEKQKKLNEQ